MRSKLPVCVLVLASLAYAKEPKAFQTGKILQMDSVSCALNEKDAMNSTGEVRETGHKKLQQRLCQQYVLQTDMVIYRIRPRAEKHPALLPVGEPAQFRIVKDKMLLRVGDLHSKERECIMLSIKPRAEGSTADATGARPNHLQ
jgi:hypothetical protein